MRARGSAESQEEDEKRHGNRVVAKEKEEGKHQLEDASQRGGHKDDRTEASHYSEVANQAYWLDGRSLPCSIVMVGRGVGAQCAASEFLDKTTVNRHLAYS